MHLQLAYLASLAVPFSPIDLRQHCFHSTYLVFVNACRNSLSQWELSEKSDMRQIHYHRTASAEQYVLVTRSGELLPCSFKSTVLGFLSLLQHHVAPM